MFCVARRCLLWLPPAPLSFCPRPTKPRSSSPEAPAELDFLEPVKSLPPIISATPRRQPAPTAPLPFAPPVVSSPPSVSITKPIRWVYHCVISVRYHRPFIKRFSFSTRRPLLLEQQDPRWTFAARKNRRAFFAAWRPIHRVVAGPWHLQLHNN